MGKPKQNLENLSCHLLFYVTIMILWFYYTKKCLDNTFRHMMDFYTGPGVELSHPDTYL